MFKPTKVKSHGGQRPQWTNHALVSDARIVWRVKIPSQSEMKFCP